MGKHHRYEDEDYTPAWPVIDEDVPPIKEPKSDRIGEVSTGRDSAPEYT